MNQQITMSQSPILFLCGHRKGGTTMLNNLFDGHSQLSVYPVDINLLYGYFPKFNNPVNSEAELFERIRRVVFDDLAKLPQLTAHIDFNQFELNFVKYTLNKPLADMQIVLSALFDAYADLNPQKKSFKYHVAKETSIEMYAKEISTWFPNCKFIHLIRDPRDNFSAIKSGYKKKYQGYGDSEISLLFSVLFRNLWGLKVAEKNLTLLGEDRYKILKFEDLVDNPESEMQSIASWLGINYEENLLVPSICGVATAGNNFDKKEFSGISSAHVGKWSERITAEEAAIIEFVFADELKRFGYELTASNDEIVDSVSLFYKHFNYKYFYFDRFGS